MSKSIPSDKKNRVQWTTATAIGAATWVVTTQLAGCGVAAEESGEGSSKSADSSASSQSMSGGEGEGGNHGGEGEDVSHGGEGEGAEVAVASTGGEGEGAPAEGALTEGADFAGDDVAYLTQLGFIRGHLTVGNALYQNGLADLAQTHTKHPRAEIYSILEPAFIKRGCSGFADGLTALTAAVAGDETKTRVAEIYATLSAQIGRCEATAATGDPKVITQVVQNLLRTAGAEYQTGIIDGAVNNLHEYQDAWGFTQVAADWAGADAYNNDTTMAVATRLQAIIAGLDQLWPSLNPGGTVNGEAAQLFGAAGQVEVAALSLNR